VHSYRHGFHAANHADVLKHAVWLHLLDYATQKAAALQIIDTHAGAGLYDLEHDWSRHSGEAAAGLGRLLHGNTDAVPPLLARYLDVLAQCRAAHGEHAYPGSPWFALHALRRGDPLHLFETHTSEIPALRAFAAARADIPARQIRLHPVDGFSAPKALLPPVSRRGLIVMDPAYEDKQDYRRVVQAVKEGLQRFATGTWLIWHPIVQRREVDEMTRALRRLPGLDWLHATLQVRQAPHDGVSLYGSGVFLINPPWTLRAALQMALPYLCTRLAQDAHARFALEGKEA